MNRATRWWAARYQVQRACTCARGQRGAECVDGWHTIDSHDTPEAAHRSAAAMSNLGTHRVVDSHRNAEV